MCPARLLSKCLNTPLYKDLLNNDFPDGLQKEFKDDAEKGAFC